MLLLDGGALPAPNGPRTDALTLPNPLMPSVNIAVPFSVITEPLELERAMLGH